MNYTVLDICFRQYSFYSLRETCQIIRAGNKDILLQFQEDYPDAANTDNVNDILAAIKKKKETTQN